MVTPLHSIRDLAIQPRKSSFFQLTRMSRFRDEYFDVKHFDQYSSMLTDHLIRDFRITRDGNKDATIGVFRVLKSHEYDDIEGELGLCCVVEARVAPDHAKIDGTLGPRTSVCDIVMCLGQSQPDGFKFAFALTRGRAGIIKSVLEFIKREFGGECVPATVAPHQLVFLAREWTRDLDDDEDDDMMQDEGRKFKRLARLEMVFTIPSEVSAVATSSSSLSIAGPTKQADLESIHVSVEEESLRALHTLVEKGESQAGDSKSRKEPALVSALAGHITKHLNVDLTGAGVTMIITPTAELSNEGKVRFLWLPHLKRALLHLQEVSKARTEHLELY